MTFSFINLNANNAILLLLGETREKGIPSLFFPRDFKTYDGIDVKFDYENYFLNLFIVLLTSVSGWFPESIKTSVSKMSINWLIVVTYALLHVHLMCPCSILITKTRSGLVDQWVQPLTKRDYPITVAGHWTDTNRICFIHTFITYITWLSQGHWGSWGCWSYWILVFSIRKALKFNRII